MPWKLLGVLAVSKAQASYAFLKILGILCRKCRWVYEKDKSQVAGLAASGATSEKMSRIAKGRGALQRTARSTAGALCWRELMDL